MVGFSTFSIILFMLLVVVHATGYSGSDSESSQELVNCPTDVSENFLVTDTASAASLAEVVNCSGGAFNVTWRGSVLIDHTIVVTEDTTLNVTGESSGAEINGGGTTRLFMAIGADLHINSLTLTNGMAQDGGAIYVVSSSVTWHGDTLFVNNTATNYGGALYAYNSTVSWGGKNTLRGNTADNGGALYVISSSVTWHGITFFVNNTAVEYGGALRGFQDSKLSWGGVTSFLDNTAQYGGVLAVSDDVIVSWGGHTLFDNNMASINGGALYVDSYSIISWDGNTSFANNVASVDGGAIRVYINSIVWWDGETSFVNNMAIDDGGAIAIYSNSNVSWDGNTSFVNNMAREYGGALRGFQDSKILWGGETSFFNNTAQYGGAIAIYDASMNIFWTGETSFIANNAIASGGAIYAAIGCNVNMKGNTNFIDNEAVSDGGAIYLYVDGDEIPSYLTVENETAILFQGNMCGGNGGAIAFIGKVNTVFTISMTFVKNSAGVAGGAIYMSGVTVGIQFEGTKFMWNSAMIGGGLYSIGSGSASTVDGNETSDENPIAIIGCEFIGNEAKRTGGAMDSGGGVDTIVNTSFTQNTAIIGGALSLGGTSSLIGCEFVKNSAFENEGLAISNDGVMRDFSDCSFVNNVFYCEEGNYKEFDDSNILLGAVCKGCSKECVNCSIEGKTQIKCVEALGHTSAIGVNAFLESLMIEPGYWRATNTSVHIFACYNLDACLGGVTGEEGYCRKGYEGPYCSVCSTNYSASLGFACNKCSNEAAKGIALVVGVAVTSFLVFVAFLSYMLSGKVGNGDKIIVNRVARFIPLQSVKIVIVMWKILTQFSTVANVVFPSVYQTFLDGVDFLNFDLSWVPSAGCIIHTDFHDHLLLSTLGPLVCMVIFGSTYVAAMRRNHASEEARGIVSRKHVSMVLLLTFLVYSSVSSTLFKTFPCDKLDDGKNYLRADYTIECDSSKHKALYVYACFMVVLFVVGIPSFYGVLLYINRHALMKKAGREENLIIKPITDLWKSYKPDRFYYEVIECFRRVLLTGALAFIYPNTAAQIAVALMMATFFIFVSEALDPFASPWDKWCSRMGHSIVYTSMFLALLLKVDVSGESGGSQKVFESVLIAAHAFLILVVVVEAVTMIVTWRQEVREDMEPRIRPSHTLSSSGTGGIVATLEDDEEPPCNESVEENMS